MKPDGNPERKLGRAVLIARQAMRTEGLAILAASRRLGGETERAADLIIACPSKVVTTGLGKSGLVARKIAATLTATGTPALYLHPVDALHGDMAILSRTDVLLVVSRSGATPELVRLLDHLDTILAGGLLKAGIIGTPESPLALRMDAVLDASVEKEADPLGLVPTASTAVAMALGDALACVLMRERGIRAEDLDRMHPAGRGV